MAKKMPPTAFDEVAVAFADYGTTVRGYVRYQLTQRNIKPFLGTKRLNVLDVGGGSGGDAAWLAGLGHHVTFIEPSPEQRRFAERRFNFLLQDDDRARITMAGDVLDDIESLAGSFDLVLVHTVAVFQANPDAFIQHALRFTKPGGLASIIEKGYFGTQLRDIRDRNFADLNRLKKTGRSINDLGQSARAMKPEELEAVIANEGFEVIEWSGIRLIADDFTDATKRIDPKQLKIILDAEYEHGHNPDIRGQGQLLHFIARRHAPKANRQ